MICDRQRFLAEKLCWLWWPAPAAGVTVIMDVARLGNRNAVTDACVAMMSARSAVLGALMNVRINLGSLKDKEFVSKLQSEADELEHLACAKEKELLDEINQELKV